MTEETSPEVGSDLGRPVRDDKELKKIAMDLADGKIFTDRHFSQREAETLAQMVFMPLALMDEQQVPLFMAEQPHLIYEYYDKAGPRAINGYPMFFSMQWLRKDESIIMFEYYDKLLEMKKEFMGDDDEKSE